MTMKAVGPIVALAGWLVACSGSSDAPRPLAPSSVDDPGGSGILEIQRDDDGDGIDNDNDRCPLASDTSNDPYRDGCPDGQDAGVPPPLE